MVSKAEIDLLLKAGGALTRRGVNPNAIRQVIMDPSKIAKYINDTKAGNQINAFANSKYNPVNQPKLLTTSGKPMPDPTFEKGIPVDMYKLPEGYGAYTYKNPKVNANTVNGAINTLYKNPKSIAKEIGNVAKNAGGVKGIAGRVGGPLLSTAFGVAPVIANWNAEGSDAVTRLQDAFGALGPIGGALAGTEFGALGGHPILGGIVGGYLGDKARELGGGGQVRRDANRGWDTYLTKAQFMKNIREGRIQLPKGMDVETFYGYYRQAKEGNKPNVNKKSTGNNANDGNTNNVNDAYQNPYTGKLDSIETIINNARANGQGYNGELDTQGDIVTDSNGQQTANTNNSNIDLSRLEDRYKRQQELQQPYIEGLQNFINNYNDLQHNAMNLDRYYTGLAGWSGNDRWADFGKRYNPITTEATKLDLLNKLAQGQISIDNLENEMLGNIALAQQAGVDPNVAMANPKLFNALASIENAKTSAEARKYVADQNREAKLANIQANGLIQKAKLEGNWKLALKLQEMRNDGRLQSAIVNAISFGADPSIIYNALQGYGYNVGNTNQQTDELPPKETITKPNGNSTEANKATTLINNYKR